MRAPGFDQNVGTLELTSLVVLAVVPIAFGLSNELQQYDPAQYAEVARRMSVSGDWVHLEDNFGPFLSKPPLTFWLICGAGKLFGFSSFAVRLPTVLLGLWLLAGVARTGWNLFADRRVGLLAAAFVAVTPAFQLMVADPKVDMGVTAFTTWAICLFLEAREKPGKAYLSWVFVALGILTDGPIALAAPAMAVLPEALRSRWGHPEKDTGFFSRLGPFKFVGGLLLMLALVVPWYWQNAHQLRSSEGNATTPLFYLHTALWVFLPFTPILLVELARRLRVAVALRFHLPHDEKRVVLWWLVLPLIAISASSERLPEHLYWLVPPAALISAEALLRWETEGRFALLKRLSVVQATIGLLVAGVALFLLGGCFPASSLQTSLWLILIGGALVVSVVLSSRLSPARSIAAVSVLVFAAFFAFFHAYVQPALLEFQPDRELGQRARLEDPDAQVLPFTGAPATNGTAFYARRQTVDTELGELVTIIRSGSAHVAVLDPVLYGGIEAAGLHVEELLRLPSYPTSRPKPKFFLASTRPEVVREVALVRLTAANK